MEAMELCPLRPPPVLYFMIPPYEFIKGAIMEAMGLYPLQRPTAG